MNIGYIAVLEKYIERVGFWPGGWVDSGGGVGYLVLKYPVRFQLGMIVKLNIHALTFFCHPEYSNEDRAAIDSGVTGDIVERVAKGLSVWTVYLYSLLVVTIRQIIITLTLNRRCGTADAEVKVMRPALHWYAQHWSMPRLSGVHTSTRISIY